MRCNQRFLSPLMPIAMHLAWMPAPILLLLRSLAYTLVWLHYAAGPVSLCTAGSHVMESGVLSTTMGQGGGRSYPERCLTTLKATVPDPPFACTHAPAIVLCADVHSPVCSVQTMSSHTPTTGTSPSSSARSSSMSSGASSAPCSGRRRFPYGASPMQTAGRCLRPLSISHLGTLANLRIR